MSAPKTAQTTELESVSARVVDCRRGGWFWADNELIDVHARRTFTLEIVDKKTGATKQRRHTLGAIGVAVYCALARHASGNSRECHPGIRSMAERLDLSFNCVQTKLKGLEQLGLVKIARSTNKKGVTGKPTVTHTYKLLAIERHPLPPDGRGDLPPDGGAPYHPVSQNKNGGNNTTTTPKNIESGAGGGALKLTEQAERVLGALAANGISRTPTARTVAAKIAAYPHALEVIQAERDAIATDRQIRNRPGALLTRLDRMTAADWAARAPAARRVVKVKEAQS